MVRKFVRWKYGLVLGLLASAAALQPSRLAAQAQTGSISGSVVDRATLRPVPGAQVHIPALQRGALTNTTGRYTLTGVPVGQHTVQVNIIGYSEATAQVTVTNAAAVEANFEIDQRALALNAIVATGVAAETPRTQLPFTVDRLDFSREMAVVPISPEALLQGRVAGAKITRGSGQPGEDADIVLRGPTSISGGQSPLIIVDGVITSGSLADINPQDIADMEVVKGAAAASLYGSRAQAGVINITTKRGVSTQDGTHYTLRSQFSANSMQHTIERTQSHPYKMTADRLQYARANGTPVTRAADRILDDGADGSNAMRAFAMNPYPPGLFRDVVKQFFTPGNQSSTYAAVEGRNGPFNYRLSASYGREEGVIQFHEGTTQKSFRLNLDHQMSDALSVAFSGYYANTDQDVIEQGTGGILRSLTNLDPTFDLLEIDPADGDLRPVVGTPGFATTNILYTLKTDQDTRNRERYMGGIEAHYAPLSWLSFEGNVSYDRNTIDEQHIRPRGFKRADTETLEPLTPDPGRMSRIATAVDEMNASATASITQTFGDFTSRSRLRALYERHEEDWWSGSGTSFSVVGVPRFGLLTSLDDIDSSFSRTRAAGFFAITSLGYQNKYLIDLLARRDGSSLFGENQRWQNYYRFSGAYRMAEEPWWPVSLITEFKPRYSVGTAGGRPRFEAQYQTYAVDRGQISPRILGNADLKPELATEHEFGLDMVFGSRVTTTFNYVDTTVKDQILLTPLAGYYGFTSQWRNAGTLKSKTYEASLETAIVERPNFVWTSFVNADRTTQVISELNVPSFQIRQLRATMYVVEGEPLGVYYGRKWATGCADLGPSADCSVFDVNDDGYLVYVGAGNSWMDGFSKKLWGTTGTTNGNTYDWGKPLAALPWPEATKLGESMPDFAASWGNNISWNGLAASLLFQGEFGPEIYSTTGQWETTSGIPTGKSGDQGSKPEYARKPVGYYSTLYDVNIPNSHWVKDGTYVKLRELSLRYTLNRDLLRRFLGSVSPMSATVNLVGRNLHTWTSYEGYDPEVGRSDFLGSAVVGRIDEYSYPNYRSFGIDFELVF
jgi:TonB-linked SusC/RagA family outer membrane protein